MDAELALNCSLERIHCLCNFNFTSGFSQDLAEMCEALRALMTYPSGAMTRNKLEAKQGFQGGLVVFSLSERAGGTDWSAAEWVIRDKQPMTTQPKRPGGSQRPIPSTPNHHRALIPHRNPTASNMGRFSPSTESARLDDRQPVFDKGRRSVGTG